MTKYYLTISSVNEEGTEAKCDIGYNGPDVLEVFNECKRRFHVEGKYGWDFLIDLHSDEQSHISDPVCFKREHFKEVTGQEPKTHEEYAEFDRQYWAAAFAAYDAENSAQAWG